VLGSTDYSQGSEVLRDADIAMYRAKAYGKARYEIFNPEMHLAALKQLHLESDLRRAVEHHQFVLYYQPIVSLTTGAIVGFEALIRWQHPLRGIIQPNEFIPMAEETGLIVPIGRLVLREACRQIRHWQMQFPSQSPLKVSVNLSAQQLRPNLVEQIDQILLETHLDGSSLNLEITESMLIENVEDVIVVLSQLRSRSIQLSIDDFGTGYSSLSYLHRFPIHALKIDRLFVNCIGKNGENRDIAETIITLAHQLGLVAIAEGIETDGQLAQLKVLGCEMCQGYLFSPPLSTEEAEALLRESAMTR
jgi:EAL domain-containing protein (putative c-di-GMP-specific phosphodiesterase class I)